MPRKDPLDNLAHLAAEEYEQLPPIYEIPVDWPPAQQPDGRPTDNALDVTYLPNLMEGPVVTVMLDHGLNPLDWKLQRKIARRAIKLVADYETDNESRQRLAHRLKNPLH